MVRIKVYKRVILSVYKDKYSHLLLHVESISTFSFWPPPIDAPRLHPSSEIQYGGAIRLWNRAGSAVTESTLQYLRVFLSKSSSSWIERVWNCKLIQCFCVQLYSLCYIMCEMMIVWWKTWKDFRVTMSSSWHVYLCRMWRFSLRVRRCGEFVCVWSVLVSVRLWIHEDPIMDWISMDGYR